MRSIKLLEYVGEIKLLGNGRRPSAKPCLGTSAGAKAIATSSSLAKPAAVFPEYVFISLDSGFGFRYKREALKQVSGYFHGAFSLESQWCEASSGRLEINGVGKGPLRVFNQWFKTRDVSDLSTILPQFNTPQQGLVTVSKGLLEIAKCNPEIDLLVDTWILADYLICPGLQNVVVDQLTRLYKKAPKTPLYNLEYIYTRTAPGSKLRHLISDVVGYHIPWPARAEAPASGIFTSTMEMVGSYRSAEEEEEMNDFNHDPHIVWDVYPCEYHVHLQQQGLPILDSSTSFSCYSWKDRDANGNPW